QATGVPGEVVCAVSGGNVLSGIRFGPSTGYKTDYKSIHLGPLTTNWVSCAPVFDGSGDAVCAYTYNSGIGLYAFRFNPQTNYETTRMLVDSGFWFDRPSCAPAGLGD